jgi:hypothetical protein
MPPLHWEHAAWRQVHGRLPEKRIYRDVFSVDKTRTCSGFTSQLLEALPAACRVTELPETQYGRLFATRVTAMSTETRPKHSTVYMECLRNHQRREINVPSKGVCNYALKQSTRERAWKKENEVDKEKIERKKHYNKLNFNTTWCLSSAVQFTYFLLFFIHFNIILKFTLSSEWYSSLRFPY